MRKQTALLSGVVAALLLACALTGCGGGEQARAREYLNAAYEKSFTVARKQVEFEDKGEELMALYQQTTEVTPDSMARMQAYLNELVALAGEISEAAGQTREDYEKVLELEDVEDYKAYARNKIKVLDLTDRKMELLGSFYEIVNGAFEKVQAGVAPDEKTIIAETQSLIEERDRIDEQIEELNQEAAELSEELGVDYSEGLRL